MGLQVGYVQLVHTNQVIPENLQKYVSGNHSLPRCKVLPVHFSNNILIDCLLTCVSGGCTFKRAQNPILNVCGPRSSEVEISKPFYIFK